MQRAAARSISSAAASPAARYGMNFQYMPELHGRYSYYWLMVLVLVVCVALYRYLRKVQWL